MNAPGGGPAEHTLILPGMVASMAEGARVSTARLGPNAWGVLLADGPDGAAGDHVRAVLHDEVWSSSSADRPPSSVLRAADQSVREARRATSEAPPVSAVYARLELDACGAWITLANGGPARPVVVRRAGWVDVRGHPSAALGEGASSEAADDRVGLGPGDALVLHTRPLGVSTEPTSSEAIEEAFLDALVDASGHTPDDIVTAACVHLSEHNSDAGVAVIAVPHQLGRDPVERVVEATGIPAEELELPGYPLGDLQPELWREPPRPPRLARLRLDANPASARGVRRLLDRLLASWRLDGRIAENDLKLLATELSVNAIVHAKTTAKVTVRYLGRAVRVEVDDASPTMPEQRIPGPDETSGRGLMFVGQLASSWGVAPTPGGKRVWCEVPVGA